ncbi:MAG TPA: transposase [Micromonosporaceae bacterium]|nr:transposase [Micromonosporaceae bacterium]
MAGGKKSAAAAGAWLCFEDESGQSLRPPKATTWGPQGCTPVAKVSGKGSGRVSVAGLVAAKPGQRSRLFYRTRTSRGRKGERKGFTEADYAALLTAAHRQLKAPVVVVWDGLNTHTSKVMRHFVDSHDWLTVVQLTAYAPDLNPAEGAWSHVKRHLGNLAARSVDQLAAVVRTLLKRIQHRPGLIDGFIAGTGLSIQPQAP